MSFRLLFDWNVQTTFSSHLCFLVIVDTCVVCVVSGCCNKPSLFFLCSLRVVLWMYQSHLQYWRILHLFFIHTVCLSHLWDKRLYVSSLVLFFGPFVEFLPTITLRMISSISLEGQPMCLSLWLGFSWIVLFWLAFSFSRDF